MDLSNFEKLEGKIGELISQNTSLKRENSILQEKLSQKDQDIQDLMNKTGEFHKEKHLVYNKVVDLIDKLEEVGLSDY